MWQFYQQQQPMYSKHSETSDEFENFKTIIKIKIISNKLLCFQFNTI